MTDELIINLKLTLKQSYLISNICEMVSRLHMGQMDVLQDISPDVNWNQCKIVKQILFPELGQGGYYGIHNEKISDDARQLFDIHQVVRHHLAWREQSNTPETRNWSKQMFVNFDNPDHLSQEPLPEISETKQSKEEN